MTRGREEEGDWQVLNFEALAQNELPNDFSNVERTIIKVIFHWDDVPSVKAQIFNAQRHLT